MQAQLSRYFGTLFSAISGQGGSAVLGHFRSALTRSITMERVDTMTEAIQKLMHNDYIFIGINGDATDFMPLLKIMRSATNIPIMIATSNFTADMQVAAIKNGADLYAPWHDTPAGNVSSVLVQIERITNERKATQQFLFHGGLLMSIIHRTVSIGQTKIDLTRREFDLLQYLMINHGIPLSFGQIYNHVWGSDYEDNPREALRNAVKRLRDKLGAASNGTEFIESIRDFGYRFY